MQVTHISFLNQMTDIREKCYELHATQSDLRVHNIPLNKGR
jgi:hypothetical protein